MAPPAAAPDACPGLRSGWRDRRGGFQTLPYNAGRMPKRYPARRRRPALVVRAEPGSLHSLRSVEMTGSGDRVPACREMSCFVMFGRDSPRWPPCSLSAAAPSSPFPCAVRTRQTILSNAFFLHPPLRSKPRRRPGPPQTAGRRRPPKKRFCSYNVPMRASSSFLRRLRPGSGLRIPLLKGQGRARREWVRYSESPPGKI